MAAAGISIGLLLQRPTRYGTAITACLTASSLMSVAGSTLVLFGNMIAKTGSKPAVINGAVYLRNFGATRRRIIDWPI